MVATKHVPDADTIFGELRDAMESWTENGDVGGLAWSVGVGDDMYSAASGWLDPDVRQRPVPDDGVFRLSSVSKPIVAVAALQLVDDGLIGLDDPVDGPLDELADREVLTDPDGPLDQLTVPAERSMTLRDLLSFRCGLGMDFAAMERPDPVLERLWARGVGPGPTAPPCPPDEFMARLADLPLVDQPGTRWRYHVGSEIVSVLIERLRGETLDVVLARDVFEPLEMHDTGFWVRDDQRDRFGVCRMIGDDGRYTTWDEPNGRWVNPPAFRSGATGLVSTTADLLAFGQMMLHGGTGPHERIVAAELVAEMTSNQLSEPQRRAAQIDDARTLGWGLGLGVRHEAGPGGWPPAGSYGWDGGLGSRWLVDPSRDLCAVLLTTDAFSSPTGTPVMDDFLDSLRTALT